MDAFLKSMIGPFVDHWLDDWMQFWGQLCKTEATLQNKYKSVALSILRERLGVKIRTYKEIVGFRKF